MPKRVASIPVSALADEAGAGLSVDRMTLDKMRAAEKKKWDEFQRESHRSHRHAGHTFFLLEKGSINIEIDFTLYRMKAPSILYLHPDQVHRTIASEKITVCNCAIDSGELNRENAKWLSEIFPASPLAIDKKLTVLLSRSFDLLLEISQRRSDKLLHSTLNAGCNALAAMIISRYLDSPAGAVRLSRFEVVTRGFRNLLEKKYADGFRPSDYAGAMNISTAYLNECVKHSTGHSVSELIRERIVLEAKRLLYYSGDSIKEIAWSLGFDDQAYFSRLFLKAAGTTPLAFRQKNRD